MVRAAELISSLFDPLPTTLLVGLIGIFATPMDRTDRLFWLLLVGAMGVLVAFILLWFVRSGYVLDASLAPGDDRHRDRLGVLWITDGLLGLAVLIAWFLGRAEPMWSVLVAMTAVLITITLITTRYKVSLHMVGVTSLVTILLIQYRSRALLALLLIPIIAWSRRVLNRHTPFQLFWGTVVTAGLITLVFTLTGRL